MITNKIIILNDDIPGENLDYWTIGVEDIFTTKEQKVPKEGANG